MRRTPHATVAILVLWFTGNCWGANIAAPSPLDDDARLHDVQFVGMQHGWAVGDRGVIWKTHNAGLTWDLVPSGCNCVLRKVCFLTEQVGWIAGGRTQPHTQIGSGVLLFTDDGGATWERLGRNELPQLTYVRFFGLEEGVVVGQATAEHPTGVLFTRDGGRTWSDAAGPTTEGWRAAEFADPQAGAVGGRRGRFMLAGGGRLLASPRPPLGARTIRAIRLQDDHRGWLVGDGGLVLTTASGGVVWESPPGRLPDQLADLVDFHAVDAVGDDVWLAGVPGSVVWHSPDAGKTWTEQFTSETAPLAAIDFVNESHGVAVGAFGLILRTTDGGATWRAVRGGGRRAAALAVHARPEQVSLHLLARVSAEEGYRSVVILPAHFESGSDVQNRADLDLRLHEAVVAVGGAAANLGWRFPIAAPELDRDRERLVAEWSRRNEGKVRLQQLLLGGLVAKLRTWRPNVVILGTAPDDDALTATINDAVLHAVAQAADPTRYPEQQQLAGLPAWRVDRVYQRLPSGSTGTVHVDVDELLPRLCRTSRVAAAPAYRVLLPELPVISGREAYRTVLDTEEELSSGFFAGLSLWPGSAARRELLPIDEAKLDRQRRLARRSRNFRAYTEQFLSEPRMAAQLIGQLGEVTAGMDGEQAALELSQLADDYRRQSQFDLAEATYTELAQRHPDQPAARDAMRWLLHFWSSTETAWQRSRQAGVSGTKITNDPRTAVRRASAAFAVSGEERPRMSTNLPTDDPRALRTAAAAGRLNVGPGFEQGADWRTARVRGWHDQANRIAQFLEDAAPALFRTPEIQFPLAALRRHRGSAGEADSIYRRYQAAAAENTWRRAAESEIQLSQPAGAPPGSMRLCRRAETPPLLDGVLSDPCWQAADEIVLTTRADETVDPADHAFSLLAYDDEFLYFAASVPRAPGLPDDRPQHAGRTHDADLAGMDRVSLILDVDRDYTTYYAFHVDQRGWAAESCWGDASFDPQWYIFADGDETHWRIETAIPLSELVPSPPAVQEVWAASIVRTMPALGLQSWTHPASTRPQAGQFGLLRFQ